MAAIKKSDLNQNLTKVQKAEADQLEKVINKELANKWEGKEVWIGLYSMHKRSIEEVMARFVAAGWKVRIERDQREGDSIVLS